MPGMGRGNSRQMRQMMKKLQQNMREYDDVEEVIIRRRNSEIVITDASVTEMDIQGQTSWQIMGEARERAKTTSGEAPAEEEPAPAEIPQEDIELVAGQAGVSEEEAKAALEACGGEPAEAIIKLLSEKG